MKNADQPINPVYGKVIQSTGIDGDWFKQSNPMAGLTKREYFAAMAMNGYCGGEYTGQSGMPPESIAKWAVGMADELLKQLEK